MLLICSFEVVIHSLIYILSLSLHVYIQLLHPLQSPVHVVRRTAAQVLAAFGSVDVPTSSWPTLVPSLMQGVITPEAPDSIRMASLEVLVFRKKS